MPTMLDRLKQLLRGSSAAPEAKAGDRPRRDPQFVGRSNTKEIEEASPERAGELAGHATERVET